MMKMSVNANGATRKTREGRCFMYSKKELNELRRIREATLVVIEDILCDYDPLHGLKRLCPPKSKSAEEIVREAMSSHKSVPSKDPLALKPRASNVHKALAPNLLHNTNVRESVIAIALSELGDISTNADTVNNILEHAREYDAERSAYDADLKRRRKIVDDYTQFINNLCRYINDGIYSEAIKLSRSELSGNFREEVIHTLIASARAEAPINTKAASEYKEYKKYSEARKQIQDGLKTILGR